MGWIEDTLATLQSNSNNLFAEDGDFLSSISTTITSTTNTITDYMDQHFFDSYSETKRQDQQLILAVACATAFSLGIVVGRARPLSQWQRIRQLQDLPSSAIGNDATYFRGRAVSVSDGDTLRFYHVPTWAFHSSRLPESAKLSEHTWPVRVCTIDTPETAKFGKSGQPYGEEAKERLSKLLLNKTIHVQVLTRDQYGRAVAQVKVPRRIWWPFAKYADQVMLNDGLAEVYRGGGAVYGSKGLDYYEQLEATAKAKKRGMWSLGDERESAAEYKARTKKEE